MPSFDAPLAAKSCHEIPNSSQVIFCQGICLRLLLSPVPKFFNHIAYTVHTAHTTLYIPLSLYLFCPKPNGKLVQIGLHCIIS